MKKNDNVMKQDVGRHKPAQFRQGNTIQLRVCRNCVARSSLLPAYLLSQDETMVPSYVAWDHCPERET